MLTASQAKQAAMGMVRIDKENNFNIGRVIKSDPLTWQDYIKALVAFLSTEQRVFAATANQAT